MPRKRKLPDGMVTRPGRRGYYADFRVGGQRVQKKLGTDFDAAKSILADLRARAEKADFGLLDNDYPIADLKDAYLKRCKQELRPESVTRYEFTLDEILGWLGLQKVRQLDVARVLAYREHRLQQVCPGTVNIEVKTLTTMLSWGVRRKLIGSNPLAGIKPLRHDRPKEGRALTDDEVQCLLDRSPPLWREIWYALLVTGLRENELAGLRWTDIDWEARELIVRLHHAKGKRERRIPVDDGLWDILQKLSAGRERRTPGTVNNPRITPRVRERFSRDHVFVTTRNTPLDSSGTLYKAFMRCCTRADIETRTYDAEGQLVEHVDLHSLRRTFATNAIVNGADPKSVQEILGHRTLDMTMRIYAKVKGASKRQTVARLSYSRGVTPPQGILPLGTAKGTAGGSVTDRLPLSLPVPGDASQAHAAKASSVACN
jgi:integrase